MNQNSLRRIMLHWAVAAAIVAASVGHSTPAPASDTVPANSQAKPPKPARLIARGTNAYCLVRKVPNGTNGTVELNLPVIGITERNDWQTNKPIDLEKPKVPHLSNCQPQVSIQDDDKLYIAKHGTDEYFVRLKRNGDDKFSQIFKKGGGGDAYLFADDDECIAGSPGCDEYDGYDAYLYMADERRDAQNAKIAFIDFFPAENGETPCDDERPEKAMKTRAEYPTCPLPWGAGEFPLAMPVSEDKQLGTGGGYEPP